ncbi:hypothetical protein D3C87_1647370 [compost metagenome]
MLGRRSDEQCARRGTGHPQAIVFQRNTGATTRREDFPYRVNVGFKERIFRRNHLHGHRVDVQFLGHASGQCGVGACAGIVFVHHQFHRAVGQYPNPGVGLEFTRRRRSFQIRSGYARRQIERNRQTGSDRGRLLEKKAARQFDLSVVDKRHHASFGAAAARLMALLIRP